MTLLVLSLAGLGLIGLAVIRGLEKRLARTRSTVSRDWLNDYWYRSER